MDQVTQWGITYNEVKIALRWSFCVGIWDHSRTPWLQSLYQQLLPWHQSEGGKILNCLLSHRWQHASCDVVVCGPQEVDCCFGSLPKPSHHFRTHWKENETLLVLAKFFPTHFLLKITHFLLYQYLDKFVLHPVQYLIFSLLYTSA